MYCNVFIVCPACGKKQRVSVHFKDLNSKFDSCITTCECCGSELLVTDKNEL
jgi:phage terminase large subunit GpA-like protein